MEKLTDKERAMLKSALDLSINTISSETLTMADGQSRQNSRTILQELLNLSSKVDNLEYKK